MTNIRSMPSSDLITTSQTARMLGKSEPTVRRMAEAGDLPFVQRLPGETGAYLFDRSAVAKVAERLIAEMNEQMDEMRAAAAS